MTDTTAANESMLEIAVNAAAAGHDLTGFEPVDSTVGLPDGYEARCRGCGQGTATVICAGSQFFEALP